MLDLGKKKSSLSQVRIGKNGFFISLFHNCSDGLNVILNAQLALVSQILSPSFCCLGSLFTASSGCSASH